MIKKHSEETKKKISESKKGHLVLEITKKKISNSMKGRKLSKEHINKLKDLKREKNSRWINGLSIDNPKEYGKIYRIINKEKIRKLNKNYRENNREKINELTKKWQKNNKEKVNEMLRNYRKKPYVKIKERLKEQARKLRKEIIKERKCCEICKNKENLHIHHKNYENNNLSNLILLCANCHRQLHKELKKRS